MNKKIRAYTLIEVTVTMLLSAICISLCYTVFGMISGYHNGFRARQQQATDLGGLDYQLKRDFDKAIVLHRTATGMALEMDSGVIAYDFAPGYILRNQFNLHTDTVKIAPKDVTFSFEGTDSPVGGKIDACSFLSGTAGVKLFYVKKYSSANLFN